jgi:hypothetical protein
MKPYSKIVIPTDEEIEKAIEESREIEKIMKPRVGGILLSPGERASQDVYLELKKQIAALERRVRSLEDLAMKKMEDELL